MRTFNIGFSILNGGAEDPIHDETQFDIEDTGSFGELLSVDMLMELIELFNDFCTENDFGTVRITYIEEMPFDD